MIIPPTSLEALELGWSILPLNTWKKPLIKWKHLQSRQPTPEEIKEWERFPRLAAWGLITGAISQRISLDFDGEGILLMQKWDLKPCRRTPRDGFHVDVTHPGGWIKTLNSADRTKLHERWPGLDPRGDGGYAVFWGRVFVKGSSPLRLGSYKWLRDPAEDPYPFDKLPSELQEFLHETETETPRVEIERTNNNDYNYNPTNSNLLYQPADSELLVRTAVGRVLSGEHRNNMGFWLATQLRDNRHPKTHALAINFAECCPKTNAQGERDPYTQNEWRKTVESAYSEPPRKPWGPRTRNS